MSDPVAMVCMTRCWPCQFGEHENPPRWHTWADDDDRAHAAATGQRDPSRKRCGCYCADQTPATVLMIRRPPCPTS